ncbi:SIS domain-containing protein [Phytoactinopolyspora limicola]|uniref:SIS domain-containing protein n=1 Tax=Phytoactinopolyspora limicola TaxID=2715536 RepID=UPI00140B8F8D|nr:SIS domain-containing protein [Phytoactinopolyspora limicola]
MFFDSSLDDPAALASIDDVLRELAGWGAQVRRANTAAADALAGLEPSDRPRAVVAGGPDGRLFRAVLEPVCPVPFVAWPHPGLPGWAGPLDLVVVVCADDAGSDELSAVHEARRRGCALLVAAPAGSNLHEISAGRGTVFLPAGSSEPTALAVPVLAALHRLGLGPEVDAEPVAELLDEVAENCAPSVSADENPAKELALVLADSTPLVWGGSVLAARAARRLAENLRRASGRPAVAGDDAQLVPLLADAPEVDVFADPFEDGPAPLGPALLILDDGATSPMIDAARRRLQETAEASSVRIHPVRVADGPEIGRFVTLLAIGRYAAAYLALGLGRPA